MPPRRPTTTIKYPGEARGAFGVAMRQKPDGSMEGVRCEPFYYTGKKVVGCTGYKEARQAELNRVRPLGKEWGQPGDGYEKRWPETWSEHLDAKIQGPLNIIPVTKVRAGGRDCYFKQSLNNICRVRVSRR
jgi:hypothetical protein